MTSDYSRFGDLLTKQDTRRDINPALQSIEDELDTFIHPDTSVTDFYVSALYGNDSKDGRTPATAFATLTKLLEALKGFWSNAVRVHFGSGNYDPTSFNDGIAFMPTSTLAALYFIGDGAGQSGDDGTTTRTTQAAQVGSTVVKIVTTGSFTVNAFRGLTLECVTGNNAGYRRTIRSNTATDIVPCVLFPNVPTVGDVYRVFASGVVFELPVVSTQREINIKPTIANVAPNSTQTNMPALVLVNLALSNANAAVITWVISGFSVAAFGSYTTRNGAGNPGFSARNAGYFIAGATGLLSATSNNPSVLDPLIALYPSMKSQWEGWAFGGEANLGSTIDIFSSIPFVGLYGHSGRGVRAINCPDTRVGNIEENGTSNGLQALRSTTILDSQFGTYTSDSGNRRCNFTGTTVAGINASGGSLIALTTQVTTIATTTAPAVSTDSLGTVIIGTTVTGASSAGYGVDVSTGGTVRFDSAPVITGALGDTRISVGAGTKCIDNTLGVSVVGIQTNAAYAAVGQGFIGALGGIQRTA